MVYKPKFEAHIKETEIDVLQILSFPDIYKMKTFEQKRQAMQKFISGFKPRITQLGAGLWFRKAGVGL